MPTNPGRLAVVAMPRNARVREVSEAFNDAQRARPGDVFIDTTTGRFVIRGSRGREHIFEPNGQELTSVRRSRSAHLQRLRSENIRVVSEEEYEKFKELVR